MRLLNAGAGGQRPQDEFWWNMDSLRSQLAPGTPERTNLDAEPRYIDHNMLDPWPFPDDHFDGCCLIHVLEHFNCHDAVKVLREARRVLKSGGVLIASVPDAAYFWKVRAQDIPENALRLFGEPIHDAGHESFRSYALMRHDHIQVLTSDALACLFLEAGYDFFDTVMDDVAAGFGNAAMAPLFAMLNRRKFSLEMVAIK